MCNYLDLPCIQAWLQLSLNVADVDLISSLLQDVNLICAVSDVLMIVFALTHVATGPEGEIALVS